MSLTDFELRFEIRQFGETLNVRVGDQADSDTFQVSVGQVMQTADDVRQTLTAVCNEYTEKPPGKRSWDQADPKLIRDLATYGAVMKKMFFGTRYKSYRPPNKGYHRIPITFSLQPDVKVHAPWGLMFDLPEHPTDAKNDVHIGDLSKGQLEEGFWCSSHELAVVYKDVDGELPEQVHAKPEPHTRIVAVFNPGPREYADKDHREIWEHEFNNKMDFLRYLVDYPEHHWILYFFCHASENLLYLLGRSQTHTLAPYGLMTALEGSEFRTRGIVFLNGCKTGVSNSGQSWQRATRHRGLAGYIGTESIVPTKFAWEFGRDFIYLLASGKSPRAAMRELRARHFPLSLVYGLYCLPDWTAEDAPIATSLSKPAETGYCSLGVEISNDGYEILPFREVSPPARPRVRSRR